MRMRRFIICDLPAFSIFFRIVSKTSKFSKEKLNIKLCFDFLYNFCLKQFSFEKELNEISTVHIVIHVKYPLF